VDHGLQIALAAALFALSALLGVTLLKAGSR
jgi:hypothetical protein